MFCYSSMPRSCKSRMIKFEWKLFWIRIICFWIGSSCASPKVTYFHQRWIVRATKIILSFAVSRLSVNFLQIEITYSLVHNFLSNFINDDGPTPKSCVRKLCAVLSSAHKFSNILYVALNWARNWWQNRGTVRESIHSNSDAYFLYKRVLVFLLYNSVILCNRCR